VVFKSATEVSAFTEVVTSLKFSRIVSVISFPRNPATPRFPIRSVRRTAYFPCFGKMMTLRKSMSSMWFGVRLNTTVLDVPIFDSIPLEPWVTRTKIVRSFCSVLAIRWVVSLFRAKENGPFPTAPERVNLNKSISFVFFPSRSSSARISPPCDPRGLTEIKEGTTW
jgi:hypothetical protein